jgi:protein SCO1
MQSRRRRSLMLMCCMLGLSTQAAEFAPDSLYSVPMRWIEDSGRAVSLADWQGNTVLITMAYSTCRKTCSVTLRKLEELQAVLDRKNQRAEFIIVSYDPKNDTPQTWAAYRKQHGLARANWHFLTGNQENTKKLASMLGLGSYWSYEEHILHDFGISILNGAGGITKQIGWRSMSDIAVH